MPTPAVPAVGLFAAAASTTLRDVVEGVLDAVAQLLRTPLVAISRIESPTYTVMAVVDQHHALQAGQLFNVFDTFCVHMLEAGQPLRIDDTMHASKPLRAIPQKLEIDVRAYLGVPLYMADGRVFGSLWAADPDPRTFTDNDIALLQLFARLLAPELAQAEQSRQSERIEQAYAMHTSIDPSTGLLASDSFQVTIDREVERRSRYSSVYTIAALAISSTEVTPERHSAGAADTLGQALADILMRTSRLVDCCARVDQNMFAVLFAETTAAGVAAWRKRIDAAVEAWNRLHAANGLRLGVSVGIADCTEEPARATHPSGVLELAKLRALEIAHELEEAGVA